MGIALAETCAYSRTTNKDKGNHAITGLDCLDTGTHRVGSSSAHFELGDPAESSRATVDKGKPATDLAFLFSSCVLDPSLMHRNGRKFSFELKNNQTTLAASLTATTTTIATTPTTTTTTTPVIKPDLVWDWPIEHEDRRKERKADAALRDPTPFEVDRKLLKDVVRENMGVEVGRIRFLSAGTFHKAYLITLVNHEELVARVARRFMPRLKTESEVATINFLRQKTNVPVPTIYHYDSNPYNRLGGEFILMSKADGIPLAQVYHGLAYNDLVKLLKNLAAIIIPVFAQRFTQIGSLYSGPNPQNSSAVPTPKPTQFHHYSAFPFSPTLGMSGLSQEYHVGPIISWPFFGSNRGELIHPEELNRGPWPSAATYLSSCADREIQGVIRETEGKAAPHRLHLDPDEIHSSRHHRLRAVPGDQSDDSDEWNLEESEDEWEGPGDAMYRDYRRNQRSTFLVAHMKQREDAVRGEMGRWRKLMENLMDQIQKDDGPEEFGLDCHDLSLENVFVDKNDHTKITCVIDWESTTTRPLWACAHVPTFLQSSPFVTKLFRQAIAQLPNDPIMQLQFRKEGKSHNDLATLCRQWLSYESAGTRLRMAHRCAEWDGWEEGLVDSILGPEEFEGEWLVGGDASATAAKIQAMVGSPHGGESEVISRAARRGSTSARTAGHVQLNGPLQPQAQGSTNGRRSHPPIHKQKLAQAAAAVKLSSKLPMLAEQEKEQVLNTTGDICGGRGGELGRRLEAWLTVDGRVDVRRRRRRRGQEEEQEEEHEEEEEEEEETGSVAVDGW